MSRTSRWKLWSLPFSLAVGMALAACGATAGTPVPVGGADASSATSSDAAPSDSGGGIDQSRTVALKMLVRVANTYIPDGSQSGAAIEVWAGAPDTSGK